MTLFPASRPARTSALVPTRWQARALSLCLLLSAAPAWAQAPQGQSMEERLRAQLRITTAQLQQAQNELAALKAGAPAAPAAAPAAVPTAQADALRKDLAQARAEAAAERSARAQATENATQLRAQAQAMHEKAAGQVAQYREAYDGLLKMARASDAERQRLLTEASTQRTALGLCEAKNVQLYAAGQDILRAYETVDLGSVFAARQPFAAQSRVKYEQIAQQYGDQLYEGRFDPRSVQPPAASPAAAPTAAPTAAGPAP